ncbi:MAG: ATP-binding protein [Candidatus Paceibacterota bacterium]|jgi:hypothetical protein
MIIKRWLKSKIIESLKDNRITIIYGARQVGKTTLVKQITEEFNGKYLLCEEPDVNEALTKKTSTEMKFFFGDHKLIILDEAQSIENIGLSLKIIHDTYPDIKIIATGSSSFDLMSKISEPLTGRNIPFMLYPISYQEYSESIGHIESKRLLKERILYGMYPHIINSNDIKRDLKILSSDYLLRDVLRIDQVRKPIILEKLVKLLALQSGSEVSFQEIAQKLEVSRGLVMDYVRLLEQAFIIFRLPPLAKNPRDEITRFEKVFFYDTGIRNALIDTFTTLENRQDSGQLFENFFISERMKQYQRFENEPKPHFWRTKNQSEIDLVEEYHDKLDAFECKINSKKSIKTRAWNNSYPNYKVKSVSLDTIFEIITTDK